MAIFLNENVANGLSANATFQIGKSDLDTLGNAPENGVVLPWVIAPAFSWLEYDCRLECYLDSGIAIHRPLPQSGQRTDSLGVDDIDNDVFGSNTIGVNLKSNGRFTGIVQRMATSVYRFCLKGSAMRAGYQITIPRLVTVAGVPAIPDDEVPQKAFNHLWGNNSGVPIYYAAWELWYTIAVPPKEEQLPPTDLADHISADQAVPSGIQTGFTVPDDEAVNNQPIFQNPLGS